MQRKSYVGNDQIHVQNRKLKNQFFFFYINILEEQILTADQRLTLKKYKTKECCFVYTCNDSNWDNFEFFFLYENLRTLVVSTTIVSSFKAPWKINFNLQMLKYYCRKCQVHSIFIDGERVKYEESEIY